MNKIRPYRMLSVGIFLLTILMVWLGNAGAAGSEENAPAIDWVEIAYGKAKIMSGHATPEEMLEFIGRLIRAGHLETAKMLLKKMPELPPQYKIQRLDLDLAFQMAQYFSQTGNEKAQQPTQREIEKILSRLAQEDRVSAAELVRYEGLAEQFNAAETVVTFSIRLAQSNSKNASGWWIKAGDWQIVEKKFQEAISCYRKAYLSARTTKEAQKAFISKLNAQRLDGDIKKVEAEIESAIATGKDMDTLESLADFSLEIERPDLAWRLNGRLAVINPEWGNHFRAEVVRWAIASNQALAAARFLETLAANTFPADQQNNLLYNRFTLLRHTDRISETLALAETLNQRLPGDAVLLEHSVHAALAAKNFALADQWNRQLLKINPTNKALLERQADIAIARKDPKAAVEIVRQLYRIAPKDSKITHQLAELEEWTGNPEKALAYFQQLSKTKNQLALHEQVYRLSRTINEHQAALDALGRIAALRKLTKDELKERIYLFESLGEPDKAADITAAYLKHNSGDYQTWLELAYLQMRNRRYLRAIATWEKIASRFGRNQMETLYRAECYWQVGKKRQSLEVIDSLKAKLDSPESIYHAELLVELGWRYRKPELALPSLGTLLKNYDDKQYVSLERLIYLQFENENSKEAIRIATLAAQETQDPRFLVLALKFADAGVDQAQVDSILRKMKTAPGSYDSEPVYWTVQGQREYAQENYAKALEYYHKALDLDSSSVSIKEAVLWCLLSTEDHEKLAAQLDDWREDAQNSKDLWLVYAFAYQYLGRYQLAQRWYEHLILNNNRDYGVLLGYADVLESLGAADRAYRLRMWAMTNLRSEAVAFLKSPGKLTDTLKSYISLMQRYGSAQQGEFWLDTLQQLDQGQSPSPWVYDLAVSWYLNSKRHDEAKVWLAKAHAKRIQTPAWQELVIALEENNKTKLAGILRNGNSLDLESKAETLEKLNRRREALRLSEKGIDPQRSEVQISSSRARAVGLKQDLPKYLASGYDASFSDQLEHREAYFSGSYASEDNPISVDVRYRSTDFLSSTYSLKNNNHADELTVTASLGSGKMGGSAAIGLNHQEENDVTFGIFEYHQQFSPQALVELEIAAYTIPRLDSILQIATFQNRLDATFSGVAVKNYYYYLDFWGREYISRNNNDVGRGIGGTAEVGFKQQWGRYRWSTGIQANSEQNFQRELPDDLKTLLPENYTIDNVLAKEATTLLVGGRIGRGDIREKYPLTGSVRYFASAWLGYTWPQEKQTANVRAGSGVRILGHDELSLEIYYNQAGGVVGRNDDSGLSVQYQYHF